MAWIRRIFIIHIFMGVSKCRTIPNINEYGLQQDAASKHYNDYTKSHIGSLNQKDIDQDGDSVYQKSGGIMNKKPLYYYMPESSYEEDSYIPNDDMYDSDEENDYGNFELSSEENLNSYSNKKPGAQIIDGSENSTINQNRTIQAISKGQSNLDIIDPKEINRLNKRNMDQKVENNENKQQNQPETTTRDELNFAQPGLEEVNEEENPLVNNDESYDESDYDSQQYDSLEKNKVTDNTIKSHEDESASETTKSKHENSLVSAASSQSSNYYLDPKTNQQYYTIHLSNGHTGLVPFNDDETYATNNDENDLKLQNTVSRKVLDENDESRHYKHEINFDYPELNDSSEDQSEMEEESDENNSLAQNDDSSDESDYDSQQDVSLEKNQAKDNNVKSNEDKSSDELTENKDEISYIPAASSQSNSYYLDPNTNQQYYTVQMNNGQSVLVPVNNGQIYVPNNDQNSAQVQNLTPNNVPQYVTRGEPIQGNGQQYYVLNNGQQYVPSNAQPLQSNGQYVLNNGQYVPNEIQVEPSNGQYILSNTAPQYLQSQPVQGGQYIVQNNGQQYLPSGQGYISIPWNGDQNTIQNNGQIYVPVDGQGQNSQGNIITVPSGSLVTIGNNPPLLVFKDDDEDGHTSKSEEEDKPAENNSPEDKSTHDNTAEVKTLEDKINSDEALEEKPEQDNSSEEDEDKLKKFEDDA